jgi:hypothetical protein
MSVPIWARPESLCLRLAECAMCPARALEGFTQHGGVTNTPWLLAHNRAHCNPFSTAGTVLRDATTHFPAQSRNVVLRPAISADCRALSRSVDTFARTEGHSARTREAGHLTTLRTRPRQWLLHAYSSKNSVISALGPPHPGEIADIPPGPLWPSGDCPSDCRGFVARWLAAIFPDRPVTAHLVYRAA